MGIMSISYDLYREPSRAYASLEKAIKAAGPWCHPTESTWMVLTEMGAQAMHNHLKPHLHVHDKVLITPVPCPAYWWSQGLRPDVLEWLHATLNLPVSA
jgi:hypothetical protein